MLLVRLPRLPWFMVLRGSTSRARWVRGVHRRSEVRALRLLQVCHSVLGKGDQVRREGTYARKSRRSAKDTRWGQGREASGNPRSYGASPIWYSTFPPPAHPAPQGSHVMPSCRLLPCRSLSSKRRDSRGMPPSRSIRVASSAPVQIAAMSLLPFSGTNRAFALATTTATPTRMACTSVHH